jgi:hypothetical protein
MGRAERVIRHWMEFVKHLRHGLEGIPFIFGNIVARL